MTRRLTALLWMSLTIMGAMRANAATLVLDRFDDGDFLLSSSGATSDTSGITSPLVDQRLTSGVGAENWTASVVGIESVFSYSVDQVVFSTRRNRIALSYSNQASGQFSLAGYSAFLLQFSDLMGEGVLRVSLNGAFVSGDIPLTNADEVFVPFTEIGNPDFGALSSVEFSFIAVTQEFSLTLDELSAIPEPSSAFLLGLSGLFGVTRRSRPRLLKAKNKCRTRRGCTTRYPAGSRRLNPDENLLP